MITVRPPGDKSMSHRALILAAVAEGSSRLRGLGDGEDVGSTRDALAGLGIAFEETSGPRSGETRVEPGEGPSSPARDLDCGNSGTTARLLAGLLAGKGIGAVLDGDASLRRRPMRRVVYPLQAMGARIEYLGEAERLPLRIAPRATGSLRSLKHRPRVASAQVKSAILLAGVLDGVAVEIREPGRSRDHTERMLAALGAPVVSAPDGDGMAVTFDPAGWCGALRPLDFEVPGDPSSAAFLIGAALLLGRSIRVEGVSENPTRTAFLAVLERLGARVERDEPVLRTGEPVGAWTIRAPVDGLSGFDVGGTEVPGLIDELPLLAVLAARAEGTTTIRDAAELRVKESDRIDRLARNLEGLGVSVSERPDGLSIRGTSTPLGGTVDPRGDHRIAMAFGVLGVAPGVDVRHADRGCARISYPGFWDDLGRVTA